jgi:hypothetical protein
MLFDRGFIGMVKNRKQAVFLSDRGREKYQSDFQRDWRRKKWRCPKASP